MKNYIYNADFFERWFERSGMTQAQLMKDLGVNNVSIKRWMRDKSNPLPVEKMIVLCNLHDIDISEFFLDGNQRAIITPRPQESASQSTEGAKPASGKSTASEELLRMQIAHLQEIQRMRQEAHEREENIRKEYQQREENLRRECQQREDSIRQQYEQRLDEYKDMARMAAEMALSRKEQVKDDFGSGYGVADPSSLPRPIVNPQKR